MATSDAQICNLALGHVGDSNGIASLTEASQAARACNLYYEQARDEVLQEFPWPFATRTVALPLVTDYSAGTDYAEYDYAYRYPSDALAVRRIQNGSTRLVTATTRPAWRIQSDEDGNLLFMDQADAVVEYTVRITDPTRFPPDFTQALALKLSAYIAPSLTGGDPTKLRERNLALYQQQLWRAMQEEQADVQPDSGFIGARD
jgi:hypothetical protein